MKLKYVIIDKCTPVLFTEAQQHVEFKRLGNITSAGFCDFTEQPTPEDRTDIWTTKMFVVTVWGESVSLKLKSDSRDARLIENMLNKS